mmetsp:Transcript_60040/g.97373  ORF Transcript_60040/g.97373 Transcript_60040/m.97373 type:complete len:98 (-) Transcript_60040:797-1090(-)
MASLLPQPPNPIRYGIQCKKPILYVHPSIPSLSLRAWGMCRRCNWQELCCGRALLHLTHQQQSSGWSSWNFPESAARVAAPPLHGTRSEDKELTLAV